MKKEELQYEKNRNRQIACRRVMQTIGRKALRTRKRRELE